MKEFSILFVTYTDMYRPYYLPVNLIINCLLSAYGWPEKIYDYTK